MPKSAPNRVLRRFLSHRSALVGLAVVLLFIAIAAAAPLISPYDPAATNWALVRKAPSAQHWFGTDEIGRDILARMLWGRAPRCWPASSPSPSPWRWACRSA